MEQLMTAEEVAELLHVDPVTIRRLVNTGELSAYGIGDDYRFARSDLADYLQRQHVTARARDESDPDPFLQLLFKVICKRQEESEPSAIEKLSHLLALQPVRTVGPASVNFGESESSRLP